MEEPITLTKFAHFVDLAEKKYPNARVMSLGVGTNGSGIWYFNLNLSVDGKEIRYEIPTWEN